jgi:hypothetical protein
MVSNVESTFLLASALFRIKSLTTLTPNDVQPLVNVGGMKASAVGTRLDAKGRDRENASSVIFKVMMGRSWWFEILYCREFKCFVSEEQSSGILELVGVHQRLELRLTLW